ARGERTRGNAARRGGGRVHGLERWLFCWISHEPAFAQESWVENGTRGLDLRGAGGPMGIERRSPDEAQRNPGPAFPHSAALHAGYDAKASQALRVTGRERFPP